jgi:hypothetical protein
MDNLELPRIVHLYVAKNIGEDQIGIGYEIVRFKVEEGFSLRWNRSELEPTDLQLESIYTTWKANYDAQEYARNRLEEYPSIDELTIALWEGVVEERMSAVTDLEIKRQAVKAKYPKE